MKRKSDELTAEENGQSPPVKKAKGSSQEQIEENFRENLFAPKVLKQYVDQYAQSKPYKHAVIHELMNDALLRSVRSEIRENVHFTPKETDIYKIHQSGDLANLDGLDDAALSKLPSLLKLRDALYSPAFRDYVAMVTSSGALSGRKTDMAINVYTPGCHLLCHDDVIGSRKVSYILYLTDPDIPWRDDWGGALRLYPTSTVEGADGEVTKTPSPDFSKTIPPAWNQLSFFAVQPGESFHDVEEVYRAGNKEQQEKDGGRVRMAISGWYHIPQIGEDGYEEGAEEKMAENSSLVQLQGKADHYDFPREQVTQVPQLNSASEEAGLDEADIDFLLKYMAPTYLTPDTMEQIAEHFTEESSVTLDTLLSVKFSTRVRDYLEKQEVSSVSDLSLKSDISWKAARPPHKHQFLYLQRSDLTNGNSNQPSDETSPIQELLDVFLPSREFRKWLELATECVVESHSVLGRRFRRGQDYALATSHEGKSRLEVCLGLTPTPGWAEDDNPDDEAKNEVDGSSGTTNGNSKRASKAKDKPAAENEEEDNDVGGHEVYMAGDDDEDTNGDAAIYKASLTDDDNVLFTVPACWNKMSIVLRDSGVLKFVKYVSRSAPGDRWDVCGEFAVVEDEEEGGEKANGDEEGQDLGSSFEAKSASQVTLESSEEEEFQGFSNDEDSDSD